MNSLNLSISSSNRIFQSALAIHVFEELKRKGQLEKNLLKNLSPNDQTYLWGEYCVRKAIYSQLERGINARADLWVQNFVRLYRDLFIDPQSALKSIVALKDTCRNENRFLDRLEDWHVHLLLLNGNEKIGDLSLSKLETKLDETNPWYTEALLIRALGNYYCGRTRSSLQAHYDSFVALEVRPDLFHSIFNGAMASRAALKLADAKDFEFFSEKTESMLRIEDDVRYRFRHLGYRALLLNQLGDHVSADRYWGAADELSTKTESSIERAQYFLLKAIARTLTARFEEASILFQQAHQEFVKAGSPPSYIVEYEIAFQLGPYSNPMYRARNLAKTVTHLRKTREFFRMKREESLSPISEYYREAEDYAESLLSGGDSIETFQCHRSLSLSLLQNITSSKIPSNEISHFRLLSNFLSELDQSRIDAKGLTIAIERILKVPIKLSKEVFQVTDGLRHLERNSEVKQILDLGSTLLRLSKEEKDVALENIASKVAHDIRSPLMALQLLLDEVEVLPANIRELAVAAIKRIQEISEDLLMSSRKDSSSHPLVSVAVTSTSEEREENCEIHLLLPSIKAILAEKKMEIGDKPNIELLSRYPVEGGETWVRFEPKEFKRILSNLINNSVEAIGSNGTVEVSLASLGSMYCTTVSDTGKGISANLLPHLGEYGASFGKESGSGLGLFHAKQSIEKWGGKLFLQSENGKGTTVSILLPQVSPNS